MKKIILQGRKLAAAIEKEYNKLNYDGYNFFETYHDNLRIQMDCAWEELGELENYANNPIKMFGNTLGKDAAIQVLEVLNNTLIFARAVIALQEQTRNLPYAYFG